MSGLDTPSPARMWQAMVDERRALCAVPVTLNGHPARVIGAHRDFATVVDLTTGLGADWAWATVAHVIETKEGRFKSWVCEPQLRRT